MRELRQRRGAQKLEPSPRSSYFSRIIGGGSCDSPGGRPSWDGKSPGNQQTRFPWVRKSGCCPCLSKSHTTGVSIDAVSTAVV